jgi:hypothetical protein
MFRRKDNIFILGLIPVVRLNMSTRYFPGQEACKFLNELFQGE